MPSPNSTVPQQEMFWRVSVDGARNLLDTSKTVGTVKAFVYTSSASVSHTNLKDALNIDESMPALQASEQNRIYTLTEAEEEIQILAAKRASGDSSMLTVPLRPSAIFGENDCICAGKIVANARKGKAGYQFEIFTTLFHIGNLIHSQILAAEALLRAYGKPAPAAKMRVDGETFGITNGEPMLFYGFQRSNAASVGLPVKE